MKSHEQKIHKFVMYFEKQVDIIKSATFNKNNALFKKILYSAILDTLSKTTAHPKKGNRERFVDFISKFSLWEFSDRISLPHIIRFLEYVPDPEFSELRQYAFSLFDNWISGTQISLDNDPHFHNVKEKWPPKVPKPFEDISLEYFQHKNLFYRYRNSIIHELREPGYGIEFDNDKEPLYHSMTDSDTNITTWELVYPFGFYETICKNCLCKLEKYLIEERINPYSHFSFGSYFINELNL